MRVQKLLNDVLCEPNGSVAYSESKLKYDDDIAALNYTYEKGRLEGLRESAVNMLKAGIDPKFIQEITGIPLEEINSL